MFKGYTHQITYLKYVEFFGAYIEHGFPTTEDAVALHVKSLNRSKLVKDVKVTLL